MSALPTWKNNGLALVGFDSFELVRIAGQQAAQAAESVAPAMAGLF